ncbi:nucleotidyltransferase family protein [Pukyongiella litopenaei]|uniref:Nucleotidyltransferase family protein n=1 Tax=Pukyongiella litopenaei TaxID=2605946 RepID=A0A2S0MTE3_9RHOB|nr:nucleotidyltransferase family protein [Pukyongiella litopenaei]AVO39160.1 nucleotidyltransferase family protein [Pukyongiella litopenaei]
MAPVTDLPILILAAGGSTRMRGRDKLMEEVGGQPLLARQARMARAVTAGPVIVALPRAPHPRHAALAGLGVTALEVAQAAEGMNASLRAAFAAVPDTAPAAMLLLGDLPALQPSDLAAVFAAVDLHSDILAWRGATEDNRPGHPVVVARALFPEFLKLTGDGGGRAALAAAGDRVCLVSLPGQRARTDLDTPEDWQAWHAGNRDGMS